MPEFADFDQRHYRTVGVRQGYGEWAVTYDGNVEDIMDVAVVALLGRLTAIEWPAVTRVADLGCGSGRTAQWLRTRGDLHIDGVDLTPEMLHLARTRNLHHHLVEGDVRRTTLDPAAYDLVICSLVDEHLAELTELYAEAARLLGDKGSFVIVGYHPFFMMGAGMPTHFESAGGEPLAIDTHIHLPSDHFEAAIAAGFAAAEFHEALVDDRFIARKPSWERWRSWPFSFAWTWARR
jgi:SAM-dependent methyltransferase